MRINLFEITYLAVMVAFADVYKRQVLAVALLAVRQELTLLESVVFGIAASLGFWMALVIMSGIRERLELARIPVPLQGTAITLITAGILSLAFMGFRGMLTL